VNATAPRTTAPRSASIDRIEGLSRRSARCAEDDRSLSLDPHQGGDGRVDRGCRVARPYGSSDDDGVVAGDVDDGRFDISFLPLHGTGSAFEVHTQLRVACKVFYFDEIGADQGGDLFGDGAGSPGLRVIDDTDRHTGRCRRRV